MNNQEKKAALLEFCKTLKYTQKIAYSDEGNLNSVNDIYDIQQPSRGSEKPFGLWYSHGRSWVGWLAEQRLSWSNHRLSAITHIYQVYLRKERICFVSNEQEFDEFEERFAHRDKSRVRWDKVAKKYDGIDIRFLRNKAHDPASWYCAWDVSSGCIWEPRGIQRIRTLLSFVPTWTMIEHPVQHHLAA